MKTIKETKRLIIDVINEILFILRILEFVSSYDIPVDITKIPIIGINNNDESNIG